MTDDSVSEVSAEPTYGNILAALQRALREADPSAIDLSEGDDFTKVVIFSALDLRAISSHVYSDVFPGLSAGSLPRL